MFGYLNSCILVRRYFTTFLMYGALKVPGWWGAGGWVVSYPLSSQVPTHVEVELGCDNLLGWQKMAIQPYRAILKGGSTLVNDIFLISL